MDGPEDDDDGEAAVAVFGDVVFEEPYIGSLRAITLERRGAKGVSRGIVTGNGMCPQIHWCNIQHACAGLPGQLSVSKDAPRPSGCPNNLLCRYRASAYVFRHTFLF